MLQDRAPYREQRPREVEYQQPQRVREVTPILPRLRGYNNSDSPMFDVTKTAVKTAAVAIPTLAAVKYGKNFLAENPDASDLTTLGATTGMALLGTGIGALAARASRGAADRAKKVYDEEMSFRQAQNHVLAKAGLLDRNFSTKKEKVPMTPFDKRKKIIKSSAALALGLGVPGALLGIPTFQAAGNIAGAVGIGTGAYWLIKDKGAKYLVDKYAPSIKNNAKNYDDFEKNKAKEEYDKYNASVEEYIKINGKPPKETPNSKAIIYNYNKYFGK